MQKYIDIRNYENAKAFLGISNNKLVVRIKAYNDGSASYSDDIVIEDAEKFNGDVEKAWSKAQRIEPLLLEKFK